MAALDVTTQSSAAAAGPPVPAARTGTVTASSERRAGRDSRAPRLTWARTSQSTAHLSHSRRQPGDRTGGRGRLHTRLKPAVKTEDWDLDVGWTKHT